MNEEIRLKQPGLIVGLVMLFAGDAKPVDKASSPRNRLIRPAGRGHVPHPRPGMPFVILPAGFAIQRVKRFIPCAGTGPAAHETPGGRVPKIPVPEDPPSKALDVRCRAVFSGKAENTKSS